MFTLYGDVLTAAAAVVIAYAIRCGKGIASDIGRHGARTKLVNKILILLCLRSAETQRVIFCAKSIHLTLNHEVHDAAIVGVLIVDNVAGLIVDYIGIASALKAAIPLLRKRQRL